MKKRKIIKSIILLAIGIFIWYCVYDECANPPSDVDNLGYLIIVRVYGGLFGLLPFLIGLVGIIDVFSKKASIITQSTIWTLVGLVDSLIVVIMLGHGMILIRCIFFAIFCFIVSYKLDKDLKDIKSKEIQDRLDDIMKEEERR